MGRHTGEVLLSDEAVLSGGVLISGEVDVDFALAPCRTLSPPPPATSRSVPRLLAAVDDRVPSPAPAAGRCGRPRPHPRSHARWPM
jgi:hypothetical protein